MPRNGSGTYTLPQAPFVPGMTISSAAVNSDFSDVASALTGSLAVDGQSTMSGPVKAAPGSALAPSITFGSSQTDGFYSAGSHQVGVAIAGALVGLFGAAGWLTPAGSPVSVPVGAVSDFAGTSAPAGWLLCYGQAVSRTTYASLFAVVGTTYGSGDGVTTFNLPDLRGRATFGRDDMGGSAASRITVVGSNVDGTVLGATGGAQNNTLVANNLPPHAHTFSGTTTGESTTHHHFVGHSVSISYSPGGTGATPMIPGTNNIQTDESSNDHTHDYSGTTSSVGGSVAFSALPPLEILNKMIYAGV